MKKHLVNNLHLNLPRRSTLIECRQRDQEGLAKLNRGIWATDLFPRQSGTKQQELQGSQTVSEDLLQEGFRYLAQDRC